MHTPTRIIGLDWGTTRLRAYLLSPEGAVDQARENGPGIMAVKNGDFAGALGAFVGDWLQACPNAPIVASGMVGSRQGWVEVPYLACPARFDALAGALCGSARMAERRIHLVPGMSYVDGAGVPDVMRGEETQLLGALGDAAGACVALLPGTHSKWVWIRDRCIDRFRTFMTGELFGLLSEHGILGRLMDGKGWHPQAFLRGLGHAADGNLLGRLFSARSLPLFGQLPQTEVHAYLSGMLIGAEIREATAVACAPPQQVVLIGSDDLLERYAVALEAAGVNATRAAPHCVALGHARLAREAGLL